MNSNDPLYSSNLGKDAESLQESLSRYVEQQRANLDFGSTLPYGPTSGGWLDAVGGVVDSVFGKNSQSTDNNGPVNREAPPKNIEEFISKIQDGARDTQGKYGIPIAITLAQAILESGVAGKLSGLASKYNNLFGIKGTGPAGTVSMPTNEYYGGRKVRVNANFKVYHNWSESVLDHGKFLAGPRYRKQGIGTLNNPDDVARALVKAGYATDPAYANLLISIMRKYNLYKYG